MLRAVIYLRVSTTAQAVDGYGLAAQERACRLFAQRQGLRVAGVLSDEGVSGTLDAHERPGLLDALATIRDGAADVLIVARLDRLARSLTVQEAILAEVWTLHRDVYSADTGIVLRDDPDDPMRTFVRQVMGAAAQLDRAMIVKRMRDGRKAKKDAGGHSVGPAPYGWTAQSGKLIRHPAEQAALALMLRMHNEKQTTRAIAAALAARPDLYPTKRGGAWTSPVVSRIIARTQHRPVTAAQEGVAA